MSSGKRGKNKKSLRDYMKIPILWEFSGDMKRRLESSNAQD
jgi:hypothetical protein